MPAKTKPQPLDFSKVKVTKDMQLPSRAISAAVTFLKALKVGEGFTWPTPQRASSGISTAAKKAGVKVSCRRAGDTFVVKRIA